MDRQNITIVEGDLLSQRSEAIVNAWNRNIIPWWLLVPHGVSGAIKRQAGLAPFIELGKLGPLSLGQAVVTGAGRLPFKCIIHVASIDMFWRASEFSIASSVQSAMKLAHQENLRSLAFPVLGAGSGGFDIERAQELMLDTFEKIDSTVQVSLVRYRFST